MMLKSPACRSDLLISDKTPKSQSKPHQNNTKQAIILALFGTLDKKAKKSYDRIVEQYQRNFPNCDIKLIYTSSFIRKKSLTNGDNLKSLSEQLDELIKNNINKIVIQSLHIMSGLEYKKLIKTISDFHSTRKGNYKISVGKPLLTSQNDLNLLLNSLENKYLLNDFTNKNGGVIFFLHGDKSKKTDQQQKEVELSLKKYNENFYIEKIDSNKIDSSITKKIKEKQVNKLYLLPLFLIAGHHVINDICGESPQSWNSFFKGNDIKTTPIIKGLGDVSNVVQIFITHTQEALKII